MPNKKMAAANAENPLRGRHILITRAARQSQDLAGKLARLGAQVTCIPTIEILPPDSFAPLEEAIGRILDYDWLVLTSVNGVQVFFQQAAKRNLFVESFQHLKIAAIGPATAAAIESHGLAVDVIPDRYVAEDVVRVMKSQVRGERVLLARAKVARDVIPQELGAAGAQVDVVEAYQTVIPSDSRQNLMELIEDPKRRPDAITFTSSSTVNNFFSLLHESDLRESDAPQTARRERKSKMAKQLAEIKFASIGPITSRTLADHGYPAAIQAAEYTMDGLVAVLVDALSSTSLSSTSGSTSG